VSAASAAETLCRAPRLLRSTAMAASVCLHRRRHAPQVHIVAITITITTTITITIYNIT
jgi:hypothetical protein